MTLPTKRDLVEVQAGQSLLSLLLKAAFIALVSFGAPAGVLAMMFPTFTFGLTGGIVCPRGPSGFDEWYDGESNQFRVYCASPDSSVQPKDTTLFSLAVLLGMFFLGILLHRAGGTAAHQVAGKGQIRCHLRNSIKCKTWEP